MIMSLALKIIFIISIAGILFSGYLSYKELFKKSCSAGSCGQTMFNIPVCVYGLIMYLVIFIISLLGLLNNK